MKADKTIDVLNGLIEVCKDGELGFQASAENLRDPMIKGEFMIRASDCADAARDLQRLVAELGGDPANRGTAAGAVQRGWSTFKNAITDTSDEAIYAQTEAGEDHAVAQYERALATDLPPEARDLVLTQFQGVRINHARVRDLRNRARLEKTDDPTAS